MDIANKRHKEELKKDFDSFNFNDKHFQITDKILYQMCRDYPKHNDIYEIDAKVSIIGRTYSASVERHKNKEIDRTKSFMYDYIIPAIMKIGLDERVEELRCYHCVNEDNFKEIISLHKDFVETIESVTKQNDRSFVSKYLHFHLPELFFLYDSYSNKAAEYYVPNLENLNSKYKVKDIKDIEKNGDYLYTKYCQRIFAMQTYLYPNGNVPKDFPRMIDRLLQWRGYLIVEEKKK